MPADAISMAIPPNLRDLIAEAAAERKTTQDITATTRLDVQVAQVEAARGRGEQVAGHYLAHPRIISVPPSARTTVHIDRLTNDRAADLAREMGQELGQSVPKGRVIQALCGRHWLQLRSGASYHRQPLPAIRLPRGYP